MSGFRIPVNRFYYNSVLTKYYFSSSIFFFIAALYKFNLIGF